MQLLQNSLTTTFGLGVLIVVFGPVAGAHFNPVVSSWTGLSAAAANRSFRA